jgi:hypothetical protein
MEWVQGQERRKEEGVRRDERRKTNAATEEISFLVLCLLDFFYL